MRLKRKNNSHILFSIIIVVITFVFISWQFNKIVNDNINYQVTQLITKNISDYITLKDENININDLLVPKYNGNEIVEIQYDINNTNNLLEKNMNKLKNAVKKGNNSIFFNQDNLVIAIPLGTLFNNYYFSNWGPNVYFKLSFIDNYILNLSTKVRDYGINNSLIELYLEIIVDVKIIGIKDAHIHKTYNYVVASRIVNGKVPTYYGATYEKKYNG